MMSFVLYVVVPVVSMLLWIRFLLWLADYEPDGDDP